MNVCYQIPGLMLHRGNGGNCLRCPLKCSNRKWQIPHRGALYQGTIALPLQVWSIRPEIPMFCFSLRKKLHVVSKSLKVSHFTTTICISWYSNMLRLRHFTHVNKNKFTERFQIHKTCKRILHLKTGTFNFPDIYISATSGPTIIISWFSGSYKI